jgi:phospholipase D3/4
MVTDETAYIGTSNWSGDYFINTAGIGLVMSDYRPHNRNTTQSTDVRTDLANIFMRDWNSQYAVDLVR